MNYGIFSDEHLMDIFLDCLRLPDETDWVEFKDSYFEYDSLGERLCGLSNAAAVNGRDFGFLIYGVQDGTLDIVGTDFVPEREKAHNAPLEFRLTKDIQPGNVEVKIKTFNYNNVRLVIFIVPAASSQPTTFKDKAFIRIGSATTNLAKFPEIEKRIGTHSYNTNFEKQVAISGLQKEEIENILDLDAYFRLLSLEKPQNLDEMLSVLVQDKILKKRLSRYEITNLGGLLLAKNLELIETLKRKGIRAVLYNGQNRAAETKVLDGRKGYALGFEELLKFIQTIIPSFERIIEGRRVLTNIYAPIAIRELVANALIHQDLSITGSGPVIEIFSDRIEITNPGIPLIDVKRFIDAPPQSRNQDFASLMRRMKFCEELGSGVDRAIIAIESLKLPPPDFSVIENSTRVILYSSETFSHLSKEDRVRACFQHCVVSYINGSGEYMTNSSFRERMNLTDRQYTIASAIIKSTKEHGFIKELDSENKAKKHTKYVPFWHK